MKQIYKLFDAVSCPSKYGLKRNTRVYKALCKLARFGEVQTGYSDKNTKWIITYDLTFVLKKLNISHFHLNIAPRGGACGERVYLKGQVLKDAKKIREDFEALK